MTHPEVDLLDLDQSRRRKRFRRDSIPPTAQRVLTEQPAKLPTEAAMSLPFHWRSALCRSALWLQCLQKRDHFLLTSHYHLPWADLALRKGPPEAVK
jgi:hypothetical protein